MLSIIIPVHNEEKNIRKAIYNIKKYVSTPHEIIVVYDSDKDTTIPILKGLSKRYKNLFHFKNTVIPGPSGAIRTGLNKAKGSKILVTMADLSDDLTQIDGFASLIPERLEVVCPSRYCKGGRQELSAPFKVGIPKAAGYLLKLLTGISTSDPTNSFKIYSTKFLRSISLKSTVSFSVTLEIMAKAHCLNARILEIPTVWRDRRFGKTNFKLWSSIVAYSPWFFLALFNNRLFRVSPHLLKRIIKF